MEKWDKHFIEENIRKLLANKPGPLELSHENVTQLAQELNVYYQEIQYQNDELQRVTEELAASERQFKNIFTLAPVGYVIHTLPGEIRKINRYMEQLLEAKQELLLKFPFSRWIYPEDQDRYYHFLNRLKKQNNRIQQSIQLRLVSVNGKMIPVILSCVADPEDPNLYWTSCVDNTVEQAYKHEIQVINRDLIRFKARLDLIMDQSKVAWWSMEIASGQVESGANKFTLLGLPAQTEPVHYSFFTSLVHPEDLDRINKAMEQTIQYGVPYEEEYRIRHSDGSYRWFRDIGFIDTTQTGDKTHVSGLVQDITLIKNLSQRLGSEVRRYKVLFSNLPVGLLLFKNHQLVMANTLARRYLGLTRKDIGSHINTIFSRFYIYNKFHNPLITKNTLQCYNLMNHIIQISDADHNVRYYQLQAICKDPSTDCIVSLEDISELEKNRQLVEKSKNTLQLFMDNIPEPVIITDQSGSIIQVNDSLLRLYGYNTDELIGQNPRIFNPGKTTYAELGYPDTYYDRQFTQLWESLLNPQIGSWQGRLINKTKTGTLVTVDISIKTIFDHSGKAQFFVALPYDISNIDQETKKQKVELYNKLVELSALRDNETGHHMQRVGLYSALMARAIGMPESYCEDLQVFAPLHDVGKVGIPDSILLAPRKLSDEEFAIMKNHTILGHTILSGSQDLEMASLICRHHHERYDGTGYPDKLAGRAIPLAARLTTISDVYDALRSRRPYKGPWTHQEALDEIKKGRGTLFDPELVDVFVALENTILNIYTLLPDNEL